MGFIGSTLKSLVISFKKRFSYEDDAEKVDIRISSIPDWLYKVTVKDSSRLLDESKQTFKNFKIVLKDIELLCKELKSKKIVDVSVSKFRVEIVHKNKSKYIELLEDFIEKVKKEPSTIEEYRDSFERINNYIPKLKENVAKNSEKIEEFYKTDIAKIDENLEKISGLLLKSAHIFKSSNDSRVQQIITNVHELESKLDEEKQLLAKKEKEKEEENKLRQQIYKLSDRSDEIKKSTKFKYVLEKESKLKNLIDEKEILLENYGKKFGDIDILLYSYAEIIDETELAKEYVNHLKEAIVNDEKKQILEVLKGLKKELEKEDSKIKQGLKETEIDKTLVILDWLIKHIPEDFGNINNISSKISHVRTTLHTYVILNEIQDIENRITFYQKKLKEILKEKEAISNEILELQIDDHKEKLRKDLLIITGYDAHIIYDDEEPSA